MHVKRNPEPRNRPIPHSPHPLSSDVLSSAPFPSSQGKALEKLAEQLMSSAKDEAREQLGLRSLITSMVLFGGS